MTSIEKETLGQTLRRFTAVMDARSDISEFLGLFKALSVSTKFAHRHKGDCFVKLIDTAMKRIPREQDKAKPYARLVCEAAYYVPDNRLGYLLSAIERSPAIKAIYARYRPDAIERIFGPLVRRLLAQCPKTQYDLTELMQRLTASGIAKERINVICMALRAQMPIDDVDLICELTYHMEPGQVAKKQSIEEELI